MANSVFAQRVDNGWEWFLKRNCSISPYQLAGIFLLLAIISLTIGVTFYVMGATLILPYCFLEILVLFLAFLYNAKHANDYEKLVIEPNIIRLINKNGDLENTTELNRSFSKLEQLADHRNLIMISQGAREVYFGNHIHINLRERLYREIRVKL